MEPDGNLDDEDIEHATAQVDPGRHTDVYSPGTLTNGHLNTIFAVGPDNGPEARIFAGEPNGLVLWRNELTRILMPGDRLGRPDGDGNDIILTKPHFEETFSAGFANSVDNYRSLPPLKAKAFPYLIQMPTRARARRARSSSRRSPKSACASELPSLPGAVSCASWLAQPARMVRRGPRHEHH